MVNSDLVQYSVRYIKKYIDPNSDLPSTSIQKIAKKMIQEEQLGNIHWLKNKINEEQENIINRRSLAKKYGFAPFTHIGNRAYNIIKKDYAPWILPLMSERLQSTEDIYADWAVQFAAAMNALGKVPCEAADSLFNFVRSSKEWDNALIDRIKFKENYKHRNASIKLESNKNPMNRIGETTIAKSIKKISSSETGYNNPLTSPAKMEVLLKVNQVPAFILDQNNNHTLLLQVESHQVRITLKPRVFKKLTEAAQKFTHWIGIIAGEMGPASNGVLNLIKPNIQVFERKPKPQKTQEKTTPS